VFVHGKLFQPNMMFVGKANSLPWSGASLRCPILVGTRKYKTRLERLVVNKHSSLFCRIVSDGEKVFYDIATGWVLSLKKSGRNGTLNHRVIINRLQKETAKTIDIGSI